MPVYLDHNATTPLDPRVRDAMLPYLGGPYANPSSPHRYGRAARDAVEAARHQVASLIDADPLEVIFTSGGTEANNFAIKGVAAAHPPARMLYSAVEHPCVIEPMLALARHGWRTQAMVVDAEGRVDPVALGYQLKGGDVRLVSCMVANNETGVIQDLERIAHLVKDAGAVLHTDAVQAAGKIPVSFGASSAQLMSLSSHKIYGPKGVGALVMDRALELEPLLHGGGQEKNLRGGTENVAGIVGFGVAAELARAELAQRMAHAQRLRDRLEGLLRDIPNLRVFGAKAKRLPNTVQFAVPPMHSATLLGLLDKKGFAVSSGSACATGTNEPSHVLLAMGVEPDVALCAIRVSLGKDNTDEEMEAFAGALRAVLKDTMPAMAAAT